MVIDHRQVLEEAADATLAPVLDGLGFRRTSRRSREWTRDKCLQVRLQRDRDAIDPYSGGAFKLEFEVSSDGRFGHKLAGRVLVEQLLDHRQHARLLARRNQLVEVWGPPPEEHLRLIPADLHRTYLERFAVATELEREFGMRFRSQGEAREWLALLTRELPTFVSRAQTLSPRELYLGKRLVW